MTRSQSTSSLGEPARWIISAWTTGGNIPDSIIRLTATPSGESPTFNFGCGSNDGTASCDLGVMDAKSAKRQLQAQVTVPATASSVTSVELKATGSAAHLPKDPTAAAAVSITAAAPATQPSTPLPQTTTTTTVPVTGLPEIPTADPTLSPGGNAAGLFPTLQPSQDPSQGQRTTRTRPVANTSALPEGAPVVGGQLIGLAALALGFVLAVTRLSIRRRPSPAQPAALKPAAPEPTTAELAAVEAAKPETAKPEADQARPSAGPDDAAGENPDEIEF